MNTNNPRATEAGLTRKLAGFAVVGMLLLSACSAGNVWTLDIGDCFDDWEGATTTDESQEVSDVPIVECDQPHDNEVYSKTDMTDGSYPGDSAVEDIAIETCYDGFESFVGLPYEESTLDFGWLFPTSASWAEGDREIVCFVYDYEFAKLTGSMQDSQV
jgi:hypothetical protein